MLNGSKPLRITLARPDLVTVADGRDKHTPVPNLSGPRGLDDRLHRLVHHLVGDDGFEWMTYSGYATMPCS